jgi:hypothetical protein
MSYPILDSLEGRYHSTVREKVYGHSHEIYNGAPCEWSAARGATHTLYCGEGPGKGTRPVRLKKTVMYVGVDELPGEIIKWDKWEIKTIWKA